MSSKIEKRARKKQVRDERLAHAAAIQRRRRLALVFGVMVIGVALVALGLFTGGTKNPSTAACGADAPDEEANPKTYDSPPEMSLEDDVDYGAVVTTSCGDFTMDLLEDDAPKTVNNFVFLARDGFYDGLKWHRVEKDLVIQGGDPEGTGQGGPGYSIPDELPDSPKDYTFGAVGMANSGPDTGGSQFFVVVRDPDPKGGFKPAGFPPAYSIFGQVDPEDDESVATLKAIADVPIQQLQDPGTGQPSTTPEKPVFIESIEITED